MGRGGRRAGSGRKPKAAIPERLWQGRFVLPPRLKEKQLRLVRELCERVYRAGCEDTLRQVRKKLTAAMSESRQEVRRSGSLDRSIPDARERVPHSSAPTRCAGDASRQI